MIAAAAKLGRRLLSDWRNIPLILLVAFAAAQLLVIGPGQRSAVRVAEANLSAEENAHKATKASVRAATAEAELADRRNVDRVRSEQQSITREIVDDYQAQLADVRARAAALDSRLRARTEGGAGAGGGGAANLPGAGTAAGRADEAPGQGGLPAAGLGDPAFGAMSLADRVIATEQALQLEALIDWVTAQSLVDIAGPPAEAGDGR